MLKMGIVWLSWRFVVIYRHFSFNNQQSDESEIQSK